jgi:hypothetical protein
MDFVEKKNLVGERMLQRYKFKGYPSEFPLRSKCIALFQKLHGVDTLLFAMYVYEYGDDCPAPNRRNVYISYLDSVRYFEPKYYRTTAYHAIIIEYLRYVKKRGFHTATIWSCPPVNGDDYIFYCHPKHQLVPREDMLRSWYHKMLDQAKAQGIVISTSTLYDEYFSSENDNNVVAGQIRDPTCLPYFEGDYIPGEIEIIIQQCEASGDRATHLMSPDKVMVRLGHNLLKMKDNFIVVHLRNRRFAEAVQRGEDVSHWKEDSDDDMVRSKRAKISAKSSPESDFGKGKTSEVIVPNLKQEREFSLTRGENVVEIRSGATAEIGVDVLCGDAIDDGGDLIANSTEHDVGPQEQGTENQDDIVSPQVLPEQGIRDTSEDRTREQKDIETATNISNDTVADSGDAVKNAVDIAISVELKVDESNFGCIEAITSVENGENRTSEGVLVLKDKPETRPSDGALKDTPDIVTESLVVTVGSPTDKFNGNINLDHDSSFVGSNITPQEGETCINEKNNLVMMCATDEHRIDAMETTKKRTLDEVKPSIETFFAEVGNSYDTVSDTMDEDPPMESEMFESRQLFLNYCQTAHCQFDELRRAKHSTVMVLFQLHNPTAPKFLQQCGACYRDITHGIRYHCNDCSNFDLCEDCYEPVVAGIWAKRDPRFGHDVKHSFTSIDMEATDDTPKSQADRQNSLKAHVKLLEHAAFCEGPPSCSLHNCDRLKQIFLHCSTCDVKPKRECKICTRLFVLCTMHSRLCTSRVPCPIPFCDRIRERNKRLHRQQQLMDDRRRQAQNELYRAGGEA